MELKRPLLAAKTTDEDLKKLRWPMLLSPKIDGIRALVVNGKLVSRTLKPIPNLYTQSLFGRPELEGLDGELVVGEPNDPNLMQQTTSGVMSVGGRPDVKYYVFDKWNEPYTFVQRLARAYLVANDSTAIRVVYLPHDIANSYENLIRSEQRYLSLGYEGVMLRSYKGPYKQNRSTLKEAILLKVKRFHDSEAEILYAEPLLRNLNEQELDERGYAKRSHVQANKVPDALLGSITVRDLETGQVFSIGTGFTEADRVELWNRGGDDLRGKIVKYKSFKVTGVLDKPRFPVFLGFRHPEDM